MQRVNKIFFFGFIIVFFSFRYAFVAMEQYQEAQMAVQSLNATPFHGRQLQVRFKT
jgi:RNA recognition motif-containing protein